MKPTSSTAYALRPVLVRRYLQVAALKRLSAQAVLAGSEIDPARIEDSDYLVSDTSYIRVVENLVDLTGDGGIGLEMGLAREFSDFGLLGFASWSGPNQKQNVEEIWNRYGRLFGYMTTIRIATSRAPRSSDIEIDIEVPLATSATVARFLVEEVLGVFVKVGRDMNGVQPVPVRLDLSYAAPSYAERYGQALFCPVYFAQPHSRLTIAGGWLEQPLRTHNSELHALCAGRLNDLARQIESGSSMSGRVTQLLRSAQGPTPSIESVARQLATTARTLSRQLQGEGTTFSRIVDEIKAQTAIALLRQESIPAKKIADRLGFEDVNALRRAFKRWTGQSIKEFRDHPSKQG